LAEEGQAQARKKAKGAKRSLARAQGRVALLEAKSLAPSSTRAPTWDEDEVAEFEQRNGELTAQVKALRQEAKDNGAEYARNKGAVTNMCAKYAELQEARELLKAARAENEGLKAALAVAHADPLPGYKVPLFDIRRDSSKRGAPYDRYFEDTIAPAMLNTGRRRSRSTRSSVNPNSTRTPTHTPTHLTHTFRRAVRAAILRAVKIAH
jgi:hypothetical protein